MKKVVIHRPGGLERLTLEDHPLPEPGERQLRVRIAACGVNFADIAVRLGLYRSAREFVGWPITPGFEYAGTVSALGPGATRFAIGDAVVGVSMFGAYAEEIAVDEDLVFAIPPALKVLDAAALPAIFLTAYYAMHMLVHPRAGQHLLIHSAAGGVGGALSQLAKLAGCRVTGVVGASHKVAAAQAAGADEVIDKSSVPLWQAAARLAPRGFDAIFDANGAETLRQGYRHLAAGGKLVVYGFASMLRRNRDRANYFKLAYDYLRTPRFDPLALTNENRSIMAFNLSYMFAERGLLAEAMGFILERFARGELTLPATTTFPLAEVATAHRALQSGETVGKLLLCP